VAPQQYEGLTASPRKKFSHFGSVKGCRKIIGYKNTGLHVMLKGLVINSKYWTNRRRHHHRHHQGCNQEFILEEGRGEWGYVFSHSFPFFPFSLPSLFSSLFLLPFFSPSSGHFKFRCESVVSSHSGF